MDLSAILGGGKPPDMEQKPIIEYDAQAEIERIKAENAVQTQATAAPIVQMSAPNTDGLVCPACGKGNTPGTKFCCECGGKLEAPTPAAPDTRPCPGCDAQIPAANKFCGECGYKFE